MKNLPLPLETRLLLQLSTLTHEARQAGEPRIDPALTRKARQAAMKHHCAAMQAFEGWFGAPRLAGAKAVTRALTRLCEKGLIEASGTTRGRRYRLTDAGEAAASAIVEGLGGEQ